MSHIRLIGLFLFITAITLALAAAVTRTTHVRVSNQWWGQPQTDRDPVGTESSTTMPAGGSTPTGYTGAEPGSLGGQPPLPEHEHIHDWDYSAHETLFSTTAIPIAWPLLATGGVGLLMWFIQAPTELRQATKKRSAHRRRKRR